MRLQLDSSITGSAGTAAAGQISPASAREGLRTGNGAGSKDSVAVSGPSAALNNLTLDRASRIEQLSAAVRNGTYQVSGAAIGGALVEQAFKQV